MTENLLPVMTLAAALPTAIRRVGELPDDKRLPLTHAAERYGWTTTWCRT